MICNCPSDSHKPGCPWFKGITVDGILYDKAMLEALKQFVIRKRNDSLNHADFESAIMLSHVHVFLHHYQNDIL